MLLQYWQSLCGDAKTNHHKINTITQKRKLMPDTITKNMIIVMKDTITAMKDMTTTMKDMITKVTNTAGAVNRLPVTVTKSFCRKPKQKQPE